MNRHILYLGPRSGTCLDRAEALRRLGHQVVHVDLRALLPATHWVDRVVWKLGGQWFQGHLRRRLRSVLGTQQFEVCLVDNGEWVTPSVIELLRRHAPRVINYSIDDPLGPRDGARSTAYRRAVPFYDLCVVMRAHNVAEARARGARRVMRVHMSADEVSHAPRPFTAADQARWGCEVLFLGTWFPERGPFLAELVRRGVPLSIRGVNWHKAPEWPQLRPHWRGSHVTGDEYALAIQGARVNLGLLSKGNRDLHTTRSIEIPLLGALLCAQRTVEHQEMYREGHEALFWDDAAECAATCLGILADEPRRRDIAAAGRARALANGHLNEQVMARILQELYRPAG